MHERKWHRYRTMFRVVAVESDGLWVVVPGWDSKVAIWVEDHLYVGPIEVGYRFYGEVALNAESPRDLKPDKFEFPSAAG